MNSDANAVGLALWTKYPMQDALLLIVTPYGNVPNLQLFTTPIFI